jgi:hypothetical protein
MGFSLTDLPEDGFVVWDMGNSGKISISHFLDFMAQGFLNTILPSPTPDAPQDDLLFQPADLGGHLYVTVKSAKHLSPGPSWFTKLNESDEYRALSKRRDLDLDPSDKNIRLRFYKPSNPDNADEEASRTEVMVRVNTDTSVTSNPVADITTPRAESVYAAILKSSAKAAAAAAPTKAFDPSFLHQSSRFQVCLPVWERETQQQQQQQHSRDRLTTGVGEHAHQLSAPEPRQALVAALKHPGP